jgi:hypothetical protein
MKNTLDAIIGAGQLPGRIYVNSDGSFFVEIANVNSNQEVGNSEAVREPEARKYGQIK